jgi:hypothetical protein
MGFVLAGTAAIAREMRHAIDRLHKQRNRHPHLPQKPLSNRKRGEQTLTITLYRPVGLQEKELIEASGYKAFPPRLAHQPIFYPVLNEEYATAIARDWNTKDAASGFVGYVTRFEVRADFLAHYDVKTVGADLHQEYWIPAEDLPAFNAALVGEITFIAEFHPEHRDSPQ